MESERVRVSVLLPSRNRPELLERSIESLLFNADDFKSVEILVAVDHDDAATAWMCSNLGVKGVSFNTRFGYAGLHHYVNELAVNWALGEWMLLWNDDAVMLTENWDAKIAAFSAPAILHLRSNHNPDPCAFPAVSADIVRALNHWSLSPHNDTWMADVGNRSGTYQMTDVDVLHDRFDLTGNNNDQTFVDSQAAYQTADYLSAEMQDLINVDAQKVRALRD